MSLKIKTVFVRKHFAQKKKKETKQQKSIYEALYENFIAPSLHGKTSKPESYSNGSLCMLSVLKALFFFFTCSRLYVLCIYKENQA